MATLLAGRNAQPGRHFDDFIGVVCGTGINVAYVESHRLIGKVPGLEAMVGADGHAIPHVAQAAFPMMVKYMLPAGLRGIVVAGLDRLAVARRPKETRPTPHATEKD